MQGTSPAQHEVMNVESALDRLMPAGSVYAFLAEHRRELFPDAMFADLFPSQLGRPSVPADVVAAVLVLQALEGRSDREATEALTFDLRWKAACGLPVAAAAFHPTVLTYWRRRLTASARPQRIFDAVREIVAATGAVRGKTRRALDSTVLDDAVATQDTVTQLIAAIRRVAREVPGAAAVVAAQCRAHDYDDPGKPAIAWNDAEARAGLVDALVTDAHRLLGHLPEQGWGRGRPRRSRCWRWSPARTWSRSRAAMAATAGGRSPGGSPRIGSSPPSTRTPGTRTRPSPAARTGSPRTSWSSPTPG
jgi:hypothetical protein